MNRIEILLKRVYDELSGVDQNVFFEGSRAKVNMKCLKKRFIILISLQGTTTDFP